MIVLGDRARADQQLEPSVICHFQHFGCDLALADASRFVFLAAAFLIDALRPTDDIRNDDPFCGCNPTSQ